MLHLKLLEKQEQANPKTSRTETIKILPRLMKLKQTIKKPYKESMEQKPVFLKK
jgi:hypothetical protein